MASEAAKMAVRGNMHIDPRVIEFAYFIFKVRMGIHHITIKKPQHAGLWGHFPYSATQLKQHEQLNH